VLVPMVSAFLDDVAAGDAGSLLGFAGRAGSKSSACGGPIRRRARPANNTRGRRVHSPALRRGQHRRPCHPLSTFRRRSTTLAGRGPLVISAQPVSPGSSPTAYRHPPRGRSILHWGSGRLPDSPPHVACARDPPPSSRGVRGRTGRKSPTNYSTLVTSLVSCGTGATLRRMIAPHS